MKIKNANTNGFRQRPENINKSGRPPKFVSTVIKELEEQGIEKVKPSQIIDLYETFMNCTIGKLKEFANDENASWEVRQTAKNMLKNPERAWNEIKDRAHGKTKQLTDITSKGEKLNVVTIFEIPNDHRNDDLKNP